MAHVEKRGDRKYRARYRGPDGRERSKTFRRESEAERFLASVEVEKNRGEWVDPEAGRAPIGELSSQWLRGVQGTLKPKTVESYASLIRSRIVPALGRVPVASLRKSDVQTWIADMQEGGLSASRIRQAFIVLAQVLDAAVDDGRLGRNVARGVKLPRVVSEEAPFFEPDVVEHIAGSVPEPYPLLIRVLGKLGPRFGEAAALRRDSVDLVRRRLHIRESETEVSGRLVRGPTKSHASRVVPIIPSLLPEMVSHLDDRVAPEADARLFTGPQGGPLRYRNFEGRVWKPVLCRLDLPEVGLHVLRHSAASAWIAAGAKPKEVQKLMGHASAAFTLDVYGHLFESDLDDLGELFDRRHADASRAAEMQRGRLQRLDEVRGATPPGPALPDVR